MTICLAQAYQAGGELGTARNELERLVADRPSDNVVLQLLVGLAEKEGDLTAALRFQRQLAKASPRDSLDHLVSLLLQLGETDEAMQLWEREAVAAKGVKRILQLTDNLMFYKQAERALPTIARVLRDHPRNWEALYREGMCLAQLKRGEDAARRFQAILDLRLPDNQLSALIAPGDGEPVTEESILDSLTLDAEHAFIDRIHAIPMIRQALGLDQIAEPIKGMWTPAISVRRAWRR